MKRIRLLGLALIAVFALGAFASASAFAEEPTLTFEKGEVPTAEKPAAFTAEGKEPSSLESEEVNKEFLKVTCAKVKGSGSFTTQDKGTVEIDFETCKNSAGQKCNSPGDAAGIILLKGETQLVDVLPTGTLDLGIWIEPKNAAGTGDLQFICGGLVTFTVLNSVIGVINSKPNTLLTVAEGAVAKLSVLALWKQEKGKQSITECMSLKALCEKGPFDLKTDFGIEKAGELLSAQLGEATVTFTKAVKVAF